MGQMGLNEQILFSEFRSPDDPKDAVGQQGGHGQG
jgi:hypothetical protein